MAIEARERSQLLDRLGELEAAKARLEEVEAAYHVVSNSKFAQLRAVWSDLRSLANVWRSSAGTGDFLGRALRSRPAALDRDTARLYTELERLDAERAHLVDLLESEREGTKHEDPYTRWLERNATRDSDLKRMREMAKLFTYKPKFSVLMPTYETKERHLIAAIASVQLQSYENWELCIADDASPSPRIRESLELCSSDEPRIKIVFRESNGHISEATNSALNIATGDYIVLLDHDDLLSPDALFELALKINHHRDADMVYSDEDKIAEDGRLFDPFFKPDWSPDSFLSRMYTCHVGAYRTTLAREIGGFRTGFEGSQDYDFVLRLTERTSKVYHVPRVLYHWRVHEESTAHAAATKPYASDAAEKAIQEALDRRGEQGKVERDAKLAGVYHVRYPITKAGKISIIIPTRDHGDDIDRCLESIFKKPAYDDFEIVIVDNGSTDKRSLATFASWAKRDKRVRILPYNVPFNFSKINNYAVDQSDGEYLLFLNNDTEVISNDWLKGMLEQMQRPSIGAVGATLLYPDDTIQHAGVIIGLGGVAGHSHKYYDANSTGYFGTLKATNNYSAVTGACLGLRRTVFEEVGGFDESLAVAFNDVDLCLKVIAAGYRNICLPHVRLYHFESKSRGHETTPEKQSRFNKEVHKMIDRWKTTTTVDPYYSPNLSQLHENFSIGL